jgi:hypothetical protein
MATSATRRCQGISGVPNCSAMTATAPPNVSRDGSRGVANRGGQSTARAVIVDTHTGSGARGRPAVPMGGTGSPWPRLPWWSPFGQTSPFAFLLVAGATADGAAAQRPVDGAQVARVQGQVGAELAADDVVDGPRPGMAAQVTDVGGGQHPRSGSAPWSASGSALLGWHGSPGLAAAALAQLVVAVLAAVATPDDQAAAGDATPGLAAQVQRAEQDAAFESFTHGAVGLV